MDVVPQFQNGSVLRVPQSINALPQGNLYPVDAPPQVILYPVDAGHEETYNSEDCHENGSADAQGSN